MGVPKNRWLMTEHPIKMDDLGVPPFWKPPHLQLPLHRCINMLILSMECLLGWNPPWSLLVSILVRHGETIWIQTAAVIAWLHLASKCQELCAAYVNPSCLNFEFWLLNLQLKWWNSRATIHYSKTLSFGSWNPTLDAMTPRHGSSDLYQSSETRPAKHWSTWLAGSSFSWDVRGSESVEYAHVAWSGQVRSGHVIPCSVCFLENIYIKYGSFYIVDCIERLQPLKYK